MRELREIDEEEGANRIGEICDYLPIPEVRRWREPGPCIAFNDFEVFVGAEALLKKLGEPAILFHGVDMGARGKEAFRERSEARSYFEHVLSGADRGECNNASDLVAIMQKILTQGAGEPDVIRREEGSHVAQRHVAYL
jgi:hypothetical protein